MTSSKKDQLLSPTLLLSLSFTDADGRKRQSLCELDEEQLDKLLNDCDHIETVSKVMTMIDLTCTYWLRPPRRSYRDL